jgi:REP element-mobilizing transposase RayT
LAASAALNARGYSGYVYKSAASVCRIASASRSFYETAMVEHRHLRRLETIWIEPPIYFVTTCARDRRPLFAQPETASILIDELRGARRRHGWRIGRFVVMPDHLHFFCTCDGSSNSVPLSRSIGSFKEWTAKRLMAIGVEGPIWQKQFFDHLLRSPRSYDDKWTYVRENPVRAGLVAKAEDWPFAGEIAALDL